MCSVQSGDASALALMTVEEPPLPVRLHPLVILNVTHHMTRMRQCAGKNANTIAFGILLGRTTSDGGTEIANSYEAIVAGTTAGGEWRVDWAAVKHKRERLSEVLPELSVVGWYSVGGTREDVARCSSITHVALCETFDDLSNGVVLALMAGWAPQTELATLPVHLFEAIILHNHKGEAEGKELEPESESNLRQGEKWDAQWMQKSGCRTKTISNNASSSSCIVAEVTGTPHLAVRLTKVRFLLESDEIAQIGVDAAMNNASGDTAAVTVTPKIRRLRQSLGLLKQRILLIVEYLKAVETGRIADPDPELLRHVAKLCAVLPSALHGVSPGSDRTNLCMAIQEECQQSLAIALLSLQTRCTMGLGEIVKTLKKCPS